MTRSNITLSGIWLFYPFAPASVVLLPLRVSFPLPGLTWLHTADLDRRVFAEDASQPDIIDESLTLFRANSLFRNFEIKGSADRTLIYLILYISDCLSRIGSPQAKNWNVGEATKQLITLALENFSLPGDAGFPMNGLFAPPASRTEADNLRAYLSQARQEMAPRFIEVVYAGDSKPSKYWMAFQVSKYSSVT